LDVVEPNMGCIQIIGRCIKIPDCSASCRKFLGPHASGYCDNDGAGGTCICTYPCQTKEIHMWFLKYFEISNSPNYTSKSQNSNNVKIVGITFFFVILLKDIFCNRTFDINKPDEKMIFIIGYKNCELRRYNIFNFS